MLKTKKEIAAQFSLTASQLGDELSRTLACEKYEVKDWWTDEEVEKSRFYMNDYDDSFVYAVDKMNGYIDVKIPYTMDGDNVSMDFESVSRIKYVPTDWVGSAPVEGEEEEEEVEPMAYAKTLVDEVQSEITAKVAEFTQTIADKDDAILAVGQKLADAESKFAAQETIIADKDSVIETLTNEVSKFKLAEDEEKVEELFKEYSALVTEDEKVTLREKRAQFSTFEDFKKEVKSFVCDRVVAKSKETNQNFISMSLNETVTPEDNKKPESHWDRLQKQK